MQEQLSRPKPDEALEDIKPPTGTGMKIAVTIIIVICLVGGVFGVYYFFLKPEAERKAELAKHEEFMARYTALKNTGYDDFWKCVFPLATEEQANTNLKLQSIIENAVAQNETAFGKHIAGCLGKLDDHIKGVKDLNSPPQYKDAVSQLPELLQAVRDSWKAFADEFSRADERAKWDKKLDEAATKGWGTLYVDDVKRRKHSDQALQWARRYMKFVTCAVGMPYSKMGKDDNEVQETLVKVMIEDKCSTDEKAIETAKHIENDCVKYLVSPTPPPPDDDWAFVLKKGIYWETRSIAVIAGSWEGRDGCIRRARKAKMKIMIQNLFNAWVAYKRVAKQIENTYIEEVKKLKRK